MAFIYPVYGFRGAEGCLLPGVDCEEAISGLAVLSTVRVPGSDPPSCGDLTVALRMFHGPRQ